MVIHVLSYECIPLTRLVRVYVSCDCIIISVIAVLCHENTCDASW